jgi:hypothetical protein
VTEAADFVAMVARAEMRSGDGDWTEATALWEQVTAANPVNGDYWARLAEARFGSEEYAAAREAYQKALELGISPVYRFGYSDDAPEPIPSEVAYRIACCYAADRRFEEATEALASALGMGFRDPGRARDDGLWKPLLDRPRVRDLLGIVEVDGMTREQGWRADLRLLAREIKRRAYAPFAVMSEAEFDGLVSGLEAEIPDLADTQVMVGLMKLVRHLDDGHAWVRPRREDVRLLPVDLFLFPEGLFVVGAGPGHAGLVGARVERIGRLTVTQAIEALDPIVARDNEQQVRLAAPVLLRHTSVLHGLGITDDPARVTLAVRSFPDSSGAALVTPDGEPGEQPPATLVTPDGELGEQPPATLVTLDGEPGEHKWDRYPPGWTALADTVPGRPRPLHLRHRELPYWFEYLQASDLVYFQFNAVRDHPAETFAAFWDRLFGFLSDHRSARLVIDMRWNGGGNTFLTRTLPHRLAGYRRGQLFVIIGRLTFSAAQNTATAIERDTDAIFVGEPTGSRPNFIGEVVEFELPYSGLRANVADLFWQTSWPTDHRTWIAPDIYAPPTFEAFSRNEDPAMAAILALPGV